MIKPRTQQGFTAVELLITLFVAAAFLLAGYQLFNIVIKDGGETRAESRAGNVAYDYLRRYTNSSTNPCTPQSPVADQIISVPELAEVKISITITCPQADAPALSKIESIITYGNPSATVRYATYVDKSKGATPYNDITNGLVARYLLNGNANADVGGVNGTVYGATPTADRNGNANSAYAFDAASQNQYIHIPSTFGLTSTNATITLWVFQATTSSSGQYIKIGSGSGYGLGIGTTTFDNTNPGKTLIGLFEGVRWMSSGIPHNAGWYFISLVIDSSGLPIIYSNASSRSSFPGSNAVTPTGDYTRIGGLTGRFVTGSIDDVRIYNRPLSLSELSQLYALGPK